MKKLLGIVLLSLFSQVHCAVLPKLESRENETEMEQQRSARVHRVADRGFLANDDSRIEDTIRLMVLFGREELAKLLMEFPNLNTLVQHENQLFTELITILKDLARDGILTLKSIDLAISEMKDSMSAKSNDDNGSENPEEELDISQGNESQEDSRRSISPMNSANEIESKATSNIMETLDHVMLEIQKHIAFVRSMFERLCRKHRSALQTGSSYSDDGKSASMNQPKKVSIL